MSRLYVETKWYCDRSMENEAFEVTPEEWNVLSNERLTFRNGELDCSNLTEDAEEIIDAIQGRDPIEPTNEDTRLCILAIV